MKSLRVVGMTLFGLLSSSVIAAHADYKIVDRISVPDGAFDYATFDFATGRVLMTRAEFTTVIDTKTGKVSQLNSAAPGHMALAVPGTSLLVLPQRTGTVRIVDGVTDKLVVDIPAGKGPDGEVYDPYSKDVFVMNHDSGDITIIDPVARKAAGTIPVGGTLEFPASDGAGKLYVNVTSVPEIAVIDVASKMVTAHYKLNGCMGASGLAYIAESKLLISSCGNGMAKVLDAATGNEVASIPIARQPDAVIYDQIRRVAFIPCGGDGVLEVISVADAAHVAKIQTIPTQAGTRTGAVDPQSGRVYLMSSQPDPTGKRGPTGFLLRVPGSYEVLVVGP